MSWFPLASLLNVGALLAFVCLGVMVIRRDRRSSLNRSCAAVLVAMAVWSLEGIVRGNPSAGLAAARAFGDVGVVGWAFFPGLVLLFVMVLTRHRHAALALALCPLLALVPALFVVQQWRGALVGGYGLYWCGWVAHWADTVWPTLYFVYYLFMIGAALTLIYRHSRRAARFHERRRAALIFNAGLTALLLGSMTNVVLPEFTRLHFPELASVFVLIWAWGLYRGVTRYGLMSITPQAAADDILATMLDAVVLVSPEGEVADGNKALFNLTGLRREKVVGRPARKLFAGSSVFDDVAARITRDGSVASVELDLGTGEGRTVPVSLSGRLMCRANGDIGGTVLVLRDISERRHAEAELLKHERLATLGQVAGSIAHELRNPLGAIRNATYYLNLTAADKLEGRAARHIEVINREIEHSNSIISSLTDFARGRLSEPARWPVRSIVEEAAARIEVPSGVAVHYAIADNVPDVWVDRGQIAQVLRNLLTNACQAMPDGGKLEVAAHREDGVVKVQMSDTGVGITPEHMARLFEPLFSTKPFGTGLGLAISKAFVEANRGTITVESESGKGTTVTVLLPVRSR